MDRVQISNKRLDSVYQLVAWRRKHMSESNDIDKARLRQVHTEIARQAKVFLLSMRRDEEPFRKSLINLYSYQHCLAKHGRHPGVSSKQLVFGRYEGLTAADLKLEMNQVSVRFNAVTGYMRKVYVTQESIIIIYSNSVLRHYSSSSGSTPPPLYSIILFSNPFLYINMLGQIKDCVGHRHFSNCRPLFPKRGKD